MKAYITVATLFMAVFLAVLSTGSSRENPIPDVYVFAPAELDPGSRAAFRVVVKKAESLTESRPVEGARVWINLKGKDDHSILAARTDESGSITRSARIPEVSAGDDYELEIRVSSRYGSKTLTKDVKIVPRYRVLLTTDKPLYQPGQLIHIRSVSLGMANLDAVDGEKVVLEVEDPQGNKVFKKIGKTDEYGIFSADFQLASEIRLGRYLIRASVGDRKAEKTVKVDRYVLPKYKVVLDTDESYYKPGEKVKGTVSADYFFGKPVAGGKVTVTAETFDVEFHRVAEVKGRTDEDGNFEFEMTLPDYFAGQPLDQGDAFVKLTAKVIDQAEHEEEAVVQRKISATDLDLELVPEAGRLIPGVKNTLYIVASTPDDKPAQAEVTVNTGSRTLTARTDRAGIASVGFVPEYDEFSQNGNSLELTLQARAEDATGNEVEISRSFSAQGRNDNVLLRTDRALYSSGEDMDIEVLSTRRSGTVYIDVIKNRQTVLTRSLDLKDGRGHTRVSIGPDIFGTLEVHAYSILGDGEIMRDSRVVYIEPASDLNVDVSLDKDTYRPGEEARLIFKVTDRRGRGKAAALGLSIVDEAVFAIQEMRPGLLKVYFTLEKELAKPRYEVHFAPGGYTMERAVQEKEAKSVRDRAMRVMLAGVKNPTSYEWTNNPAEERLAKEKERLRVYAGKFARWAASHGFMEKNRSGQWVYKSGITQRMIEDDAINKKDAYDSFGKPYGPAMLEKVDTVFKPSAFAGNMASYRLSIIYSALDIMYEEEKSWLGKMFDGAEAPQITEDVLDKLVENGYLKKGHIRDPWGKPYIVRYDEKNNSNPYSGRYKNYVIKSAGRDGKPDTSDDVTSPWPSDYRFYQYVRPVKKHQDEGMLDRVLGRAQQWFFPKEKALSGGAMAPRPVMALEREEAGAMKSDGLRDKAGGGSGDQGEQIRVRDYFPETLVWEPALITDRNGNAELTVPLADSITTWRLTALGHSADGMMGSATGGIKVFQDFFVDIDFPVQLTQGDEVEVPVAVYNYLPGSQKIKLEVRDHDGFELLSGPSKTLILQSNQVDVVYFRVKARDLGKQGLTVYAMGREMSDAVKRSVEVIPDGLRMENVKNGQITGDLTETIKIPDYAIDDAGRIMVKVYPGVFAQVLEGLDSIFRMPNGCFEQTTSTTYPNVMVLAYMKKTGTIRPEIRMKAEQYINLGYQRLLSFEVPGGGFEWFGRAPAHKVLTAYGLMEFYDMSKVYSVDPAVIERTQRWLADKQKPDGSWEPADHWMETLSGEAFSRSVELNTAYITWSLAETGYEGEAARKGIDYLKENMDKIDDAYTLALALNALVAHDPRDGDARDIMDKLNRLKKEDNGAIYWQPAGETAVHGKGKTGQIETTALVLYAMIKARAYPATVNQGLAWLAKQKDAFGTFQSTQATILTFKAMLAAEEGTGSDVRGDITIKAGDREETFSITPETSDVMRMVDFKDQTVKGDNKIEIRAPKNMGLMYQVVGIHYAPWEKVREIKGRPLLSLDVDYDRTELETNDVLTANVKAVYNGERSTEMVVLDLGIPPGFQLLPENLEKLKEKNVIEKYDATGRQITVYVRRMKTGEPLAFSYELKAKFPVKAKAPKSTAYEYYNPDNRVETTPVEIEVKKAN